MTDSNTPDHILDNFVLDACGQTPFLKIYTQLSSCYARPDNISDAAIIDILTQGLERLTASFPWVAGQVVNEGVSEGNTGVFKIKPYQRLPRLVVKDGRSDPAYPTMDGLREARFPMRLLDESLFAPIHTLPTAEDIAEALPVFVLQVTFIQDGLLLTSLTEHNTADMTGQGQIMALYSKACRNEPFTAEEIASGNLPRHTLIPLLDDSYQPGPELDHQIVRPTSTPPSFDPTTKWAYFAFSADSLLTLKSLATESKTTPYISTDDALTAFIWQSITRVRLPRLISNANTTTDTTPLTSSLARAVDIRRHLNIPSTYPGLMQNMTYHNQPITSLATTSPLGEIASHLRKAVDPTTTTLPFNTRAIATYLHRNPDKTTVSFTAKSDPSKDLALSSWAKAPFFELDFGLGLGLPEAVRRPRFTPFEGLLYIMPKDSNGEMAVAVALSEVDMESLCADEEFAKYAVFVG